MKVITNTPVLLDGKHVEPGSTIDVATAVGKQLIESGSAAFVSKSKRDADTGTGGAPAGDLGKDSGSRTPADDPSKSGE
jgi:hypothetical protein